jgi:hypothetical protein
VIEISAVKNRQVGAGEPKVGEFEPDAVLASTDIGHAEMTRSRRAGLSQSPLWDVI